MICVAHCDECRHKHKIEFNPLVGMWREASDWYAKHSGHVGVGFRMPSRSMKKGVRGGRIAEYISNADIKVAYAASATPTMTLASLAASSTTLAGRESTAIDNGASNKYLDDLVAGHFRAAATNVQAGYILVTVVGSRNDTPAWPDVFDGTDSAETVSKQGIFDQVCKILAAIVTDATASQTWSFGPESVASRFGGWLPDQYLFFVTHSIQTSTNAWSATEGDHSMQRTPVYATSV